MKTPDSCQRTEYPSTAEYGCAQEEVIFVAGQYRTDDQVERPLRRSIDESKLAARRGGKPRSKFMAYLSLIHI